MSTQPSQHRSELITELTSEIGRSLATKTVLFHAALAAKLGLSATDLKCLDLLRDADPPLTASDLVDRTGLTAGAITGVIDRLERGGFVARVRDPDDRRRWELQPVAASRPAVLDLFAPLRAAIAELCSVYGDAELDLIGRFLTSLAAAMETEADRLRA
jgi:DNA-binding MarR family transcriptional regulator